MMITLGFCGVWHSRQRWSVITDAVPACRFLETRLRSTDNRPPLFFPTYLRN